MIGPIQDFQLVYRRDVNSNVKAIGTKAWIIEQLESTGWIPRKHKSKVQAGEIYMGTRRIKHSSS